MRERSFDLQSAVSGRPEGLPCGPTMRDRTRREFMGLSASGAVALLAPRWLYAWAAEPDLIVLNAKVYTMDAAVPRADAFAVKGGRFVAIGTTADIKALAGKKT